MGGVPVCLGGGSSLLGPHPVSLQAQPVLMRRTPVSRTPAMGQPPAACCLGVRPSVSAPWDKAAVSAKQVGLLGSQSRRWGEGHAFRLRFCLGLGLGRASVGLTEQGGCKGPQGPV